MGGTKAHHRQGFSRMGPWEPTGGRKVTQCRRKTGSADGLMFETESSGRSKSSSGQERASGEDAMGEGVGNRVGYIHWVQ